MSGGDVPARRFQGSIAAGVVLAIQDNSRRSIFLRCVTNLCVQYHLQMRASHNLLCLTFVLPGMVSMSGRPMLVYLAPRNLQPTDRQVSGHARRCWRFRRRPPCILATGNQFLMAQPRRCFPYNKEWERSARFSSVIENDRLCPLSRSLYIFITIKIEKSNSYI